MREGTFLRHLVMPETLLQCSPRSLGPLWGWCSPSPSSGVITPFVPKNDSALWLVLLWGDARGLLEHKRGPRNVVLQGIAPRKSTTALGPGPWPPPFLDAVQLLAEKVGGGEAALVKDQLFHSKAGKTQVSVKMTLYDKYSFNGIYSTQAQLCWRATVNLGCGLMGDR